MATDALIQRSFGGGELAPALHARADQAKYITGLRTCKNFLIQRAGGVANRPGTRYVATCKTASPTVQLLPYVSEIENESILIEAGASYLRFYKNGGAVTVAGVIAWNAATQYQIGDIISSGGVNYYAVKASLNQVPPNVTFWYAMPGGNLLELPSPFPNLFAWSQSGRVITLTHEDIEPYELIYDSLTRWVLRKVTTTPQVGAPQNPLLTVPGAGARRYAYVVTAAGPDYEESIASGQVINAAAADPTEAAPHVISWDAVAGAPEYYVYADIYNNGTFGYIGTAVGQINFHNTGFVPDFGVTPPFSPLQFDTAQKLPKVSATYKQRRFFGFTKGNPDGIRASRIGFPSNFGISSPLQDDDALEFRLAGNQHNPVRHLIPLKQLIVLTDASGWIVTGDQSGILAPNTVNADQYLYAGASSVRPVVVGNSVLYVQARGRIIRDVQFDQTVEGLAGRDLTVYSSHLFDKNTIRDLDYAQTPHSIAWAVRDDGVLLGCTYLREQEVWGWHRHTTDGFFWSVCVVPEGDEDAVYFIVRRTINGATVRYIERMASRDIVNFDTDAFFMDAGLSYSGVPVSNVGGLVHLRGKVCAVVGDGAVIFDGEPTRTNAANFTVTAGGTFPVAFPATYSNIHVGLPIRFAEIETLDLDVQGSAVRDKKKRIAGIDLLIAESSRTFFAGPDSNHLRQQQIANFEPTGDTVDGQVELSLTSTFDKNGRVLIRQSDPLPLTILGVIPHVELGG